MNGIIITAIICVTIVMIAWINKKGKDSERGGKE